EGLQRLNVARRKGDVRAFARERRADLPSHPLGRSGDERVPVGELHARYPSSRSRAVSAGERSAGLPKPPPPQVSMTTRSPSARPHRLFALRRALTGSAGIQREAEGCAALPAGETVRWHDAPLDHAGERHVGGEHAIAASEAQTASVSAVSARAGPKRLLLDD